MAEDGGSNRGRTILHVAAASRRRQSMVRLAKALGSDMRGAFQTVQDQYEDGRTISTTARKSRTPPYLLCRLFIEESVAPSNAKTSDYIREARLLENARLRLEIERCIMEDQDFSPHVDRLTNSLGRHYEQHLEHVVRNLGLSYETEEHMREKGLPRTPDIRLLVPIGVRSHDGSGKDHVISWIDSKAMYGDRETLISDVGLQVSSYLNRFGPGMVIFWFGFDRQSTLMLPQDDVLVLDRFPDQIILPDGKEVTTRIAGKAFHSVGPYAASAVCVSGLSPDT